MRPIVYNYTAAFKEAPLVRYMLNGVFVTVSIFLIQVIIALPCAYALSKLRFWGRNVVFGMVIFLLAYPRACDCPSALYYACKSGADQHLCGADRALEYIGFWHFFDAAVFHDRAR